MKRLFFAAVLVCGVSAACNNTEDPNDGKKWRTVGPRLSGAAWRPCCIKSEIRKSCSGKVENREAALALLTVADGDCLDNAFAAVEKHAKDDLPSAYFIRAQRKVDPVDFLRALDASSTSRSDVARFNRALIQEKFGLTREALRSWNEVVQHDSSAWRNEARNRRDHLNAARLRWDPEQLTAALRRRDAAMIRRIAQTYPADAVRHFEDIDLLDDASSRLLADALHDTGEIYARAIVDAVSQTKDRRSLEEGLRALSQGQLERAAALLERANNPLYLAVRFRIAATQLKNNVDPLPILDSVAPIATAKRYRDLAGRTHTLRAVVLDFSGTYTEALAAYAEALRITKGEQTTTVEILERRSGSYTYVGDPAEGFRDAFAALSLLPSVEDLNARHQAYGSAALAARDLQYPVIALQFQNAAVDESRKAVAAARGEELKEAKRHLAVALRFRAEIQVAIRHDPDARADLEEAAGLADAVEMPATRDLLRMRVEEVQGQALVERNPAEAARRFTRAIALSEQQNSTYRAVLHYKRGMARQRAADPKAHEDINRALEILRDEAILLRKSTARGEYESLWKPYFSRFQTMYHQMIENRLGQNDIESAFVYAEQARAFEPMQLLLQAGPAPFGFRRIDTRADLQQALASLPDDTLILQYLVLENKTYSWALSREGIHWTPHRAGRKEIQEWVARIHRAVGAEQSVPIKPTMRAVYDALFQAPLKGSRHKRIVIVPDGPMHGLPFAALESASEGYVIGRSSIAVAGSTSLYQYARHRDAEFPANPHPAVLIVGEPALSPAIASRFRLGPLKHAADEAKQLNADYGGSKLLSGADATTGNFLSFAKNANIIHFAGHGVANPHAPWLSMLVLAPHEKDAGDLTAEKLLIEPSDFGQTRVIVLAACSTAFGESVGAEGLAPLVRPLIAARVPAVVGTLWDVKDTATIRELVVSLHRHYRNGDDVAVALQKAQLEMLRDNKPARTWAPFQVIGYAGSPYAPRAAQEKPHSEHIPRKNPLHRPDGLHSQ